jgi:hypothetical protein
LYLDAYNETWRWIGLVSRSLFCSPERWARAGWLALAVAFSSSAALAAPPALSPILPSCVPKRANSVVSLITYPEGTWASIRTCFRKTGTTDFYFVEMRNVGRGSYWAVLPRPEDATAAVDVFFAVMGVEGRETRTPLMTIPVTSPCGTTLTTEQARYAQNLVVGETAKNQFGLSVLGFLCDGVISRIDFAGKLRPDDACRIALIADAMGLGDEGKKLAPAVLLGGGATLIRSGDKGEASKPRP